MKRDMFVPMATKRRGKVTTKTTKAAVIEMILDYEAQDMHSAP